MKIENECMYVLEVREDKYVFGTEDEAISTLKEQLKKLGDFDESEIKILRVGLESSDWKIATVSWARIAMQLLKGGK